MHGYDEILRFAQNDRVPLIEFLRERQIIKSQ